MRIPPNCAPHPDDIDDGQLERCLYANDSRSASDKPVMPPMAYRFQGLIEKHVTSQLRWYEYKRGNRPVKRPSSIVPD